MCPMPWTLYRYILKDIVKLLLISTLSLVTVISFAVAIKPLSEGLLDLGGLFKFVGATAPTMLVYALPFSAAFAVTLTFCRLAGDNEITACSASGMSYLSILLPVIGLGAALMVFLFVMSNWVLPTFTRAAMELVQKDVMRVLVHQLRERKPVVLADYKIYANQAEEVPPPRIENSDVQPDQLILLRGVAIGRLDPRTQKTRSDHTAEEADILVFRDAGRTWVQFRLKNALYHDETTGNPFLDSTALGAEAAEMLPNIELPSRFRDKPKAMSFAELGALLDDPQGHPRIISEKQNLIEAIAEEDLLDRLEEGLTRSAQSYGSAEVLGVRLIGAHEHQHYVVSCAAVAPREAEAVVIPASPEKPALIDLYEGGRLLRRYEARGAVRFEPVAMEPGGEPRLSPLLRNVSIVDPRRPDRTTERSEIKLTRLWWPQPIAGPLIGQSTTELIGVAGQRFPASIPVGRAAVTLQTQIERLHNRVISEVHERAGTAVGCMLAAVLGAVLSIYLRGRLPLVVYLWTFLIVLGGTLVLQTGARLATDDNRSLTLGIAVLWMSVAGVAGAIAYLYVRLSRN